MRRKKGKEEQEEQEQERKKERKKERKNRLKRATSIYSLSPRWSFSCTGLFSTSCELHRSYQDEHFASELKLTEANCEQHRHLGVVSGPRDKGIQEELIKLCR